jgi:membrane protein
MAPPPPNRVSGVARGAELRSSTWRLTTATVAACMRYRVTGLAAEAAFFAILSLPPLIFGLAGTIGYVFERFDVAQVETMRQKVIELASQALSDDSISRVIAPTIDEVTSVGRFDVISIGFILALWSGSRALNVFVDTITIMYGLAGRRGIVRTRMLSFTLYVIALVVGIIVLPLVLAGPQIVQQLVPAQLDFINTLYWPTVIVLSIFFLTTLYHLSVPVRSSLRHDIPGAVLALTMWILGSFLLRWVLQNASDSTSIYGPLAAPIAVLLWLYLTSIAVLIGAALNAAFDRVWPESATARARLEILRRLRRPASGPKPRAADVVASNGATPLLADAHDGGPADPPTEVAALDEGVHGQKPDAQPVSRP